MPDADAGAAADDAEMFDLIGLVIGAQVQGHNALTALNDSVAVGGKINVAIVPDRQMSHWA